MLFNSLVFALFLPIVFALYWGVFRGPRAQNLLLIVAGYVFYGWWDPRFLILLFLSSLVDFIVGLLLTGTEAKGRRKLLIGFSLVTQLGLLATFKYYDFFAKSLAQAFATLGIDLDPVTLGLVLPVGISFYTFQTLSYTLDVYRRKTAAIRDPVQFFAFVSFFPQLMAGPIERASHMLPQFGQPRTFSNALAADGLRQMLWGFFKKIVIADTCSHLVQEIFDKSDRLPGPVLVLGAVLFAFQIYCDFSGYSDIAIGCARLFGFELMRNFAFPYFARDIAEFWRRWHISLTTWFRDYLYIPLGGSRGTTAVRVRNTLIVFAVSGLWHGANWTFLAWGLLNGLYFLPLLLRGRNRVNLGIVAEGRLFPNLRDAGAILLTFSLTCVAWVFFRARDIGHAFSYLRNAITNWWDEGAWHNTARFFHAHAEQAPWIFLLMGMVAVEWLQRHRQHGLEQLPVRRAVRWAIYLFVILLIVFFGDFGEQTFIYFQF